VKFPDDNEHSLRAFYMTPKGLLFDYGGTLVEEVSVDLRAGNEWLISRATYRPDHVTLAHVMERAARVAREASALRDQVYLETAWPTLTRLIHDYLGIRFDIPMPELELGFWKASVETRAMPGAREALAQFHQWGLPMAAVSNTSFGEHVIRSELAKYGLTDHLAFVLVSSDYSVRKPHVLLFETAAARLNVAAKDIWFVGDRLDTDVAGAKASGMTAVWFNSDGRTPPSDDVDLTVASWTDLVGRVSSHSGAVNRPAGESY
jgi:putative hydrolase of the HAD superfamily